VQDVAFKLRIGDKPLNEKRREALSGGLAMEEYLLVEGPPGSGKTMLIGALARAFIGRGDKVLLAANTNQALDHAILALMDQGLGAHVVRLGRADVSPQLSWGELPRATGLCTLACA